MINVKNEINCFIAGSFAALSSVFAKAPVFLTTQLGNEKFLIAAYLVFYTFMLLANLLNWRFYLKALNAAPQSLTPTVITVSVNYIVTFILVTLIYKEEVSNWTLMGVSLMLFGLYYILAAKQECETRNVVKDK